MTSTIWNKYNLIHRSADSGVAMIQVWSVPVGC